MSPECAFAAPPAIDTLPGGQTVETATDIAVIRQKVRIARFVYIHTEIGVNAKVSRKTALDFLADVEGWPYRAAQLEASIYTYPHSGTCSVFLGKKDPT
jgi:hypothetical protein